MAATYVFSYYLIPKYLILKKYAWFALYSCYTLIITSYLSIQSILYALVFLQDFQNEGITPITKTLPFILLGILMIILFAIVLQVIIYLYQTLKAFSKFSRL